MRFASPEFFWFLLLVPLLVLYVIYFREDNLPSFQFSSLKKIAIKKTALKMDAGLFFLGTLRTLAVILMIIALARPQKGLRSEELTTKATDLIFCLDASRSMLTVDFKPANRFEVAKQVIAEFIKGREHDRMGIVLFAEHAITQCPLTLDKTALLTILEAVQVGTIPPDQTAIGVGLTTGVNRLKNSKAKSKVIILVTDGSNNTGTIDPITAAKTAAAYGIKIYTIGAGSPEGGLVPIPDPVFGQRMVQSNSDLDEDTLLKIASEANGKYFRAKTAGALKTIFQEIDQLEKTDIKVKEYIDYRELYIWFLISALFLIFMEIVMTKTIYRTVP